MPPRGESDDENSFIDLNLGIYKKTLNQSTGIICFSATAEDPVLWSHYADSHKGIAFEVDQHIEGEIEEVSYSENRPTLKYEWLWDSRKSKEVLEILKTLFITKSKSWSYEKEWRVLIDLTKCDELEDMYLRDIPGNYLKRVILGIDCPESESNIEQLLIESGFPDTKVVRAERHRLEYKIIC